MNYKWSIPKISANDGLITHAHYNLVNPPIVSLPLPWTQGTTL